MLTKQASPKLARKPQAEINSLLETTSDAELRHRVERVAVPRHYVCEPEENEGIALWIAARLQGWGFQVQFQGEWRNVIALPQKVSNPLALVGAHYDSVGGCPGADDNASAVAAMLACAKACSTIRPAPSVCFVSFNREEDNLLGSRDFVRWLQSEAMIKIACAHILEMVGFASDLPKTQRIPPGLPVRVPDTGNFLGLLANRDADDILDKALASASTCLPALPVLGLRLTLDLENYFPVLLRSDHAPFWQKKIPAVMWTDTSEFRNPFYHQPGDKPHTLNYPFLRADSQMLTACVLDQSSQ
jgi:Zn-dependent M28 family amino/carboxypeptidase